MNNDWPANLDALVAAPEHHRVLMENEQVRVIETLIPPGETTKTHTHQWPGSLYVLSWTDFIRYDADGIELFDSRSVSPAPQPGSSMWSLPLPPHYVTNIGTTDLRIVATEIKTEPFVSFNAQEPHSSKDWPK